MFKLMVLLLTIACLALAGCASPTALEKTSEAATNNKYDVDWEYVTKIERNSRSSALPGRVIWVNPPMKKSDEKL